ncbi:MAG: hypothetical protein IVW57_03610 [Ktedonobacterales bacterium]|nr:hypothetical protein [Ktedonobacterales bacterium]
MGEDPQTAERRRRGLPPVMDPRSYDPRRAMDPATMERMLRAQAAARAQAQAATTVLIATVVSLITSAFSFVAALAWNDAIKAIIDDNVNGSLAGLKLSATGRLVLYAAVATVIAIIVVVGLNRVAGSIAKKSAIDAVDAGQGSL